METPKGARTEASLGAPADATAEAQREAPQVRRDAPADVRLDKWLWAVRIFKTRSDAAEACRTGKVTVGGIAAKPSREVKAGDVVSVRRMPVTYSFKVLELVSSRLPAKDVPHYMLDVTPPEEVAKLAVPRETLFVMRDRGTGRPTKKERREIDSLMGGISYDED